MITTLIFALALFFTYYVIKGFLLIHLHKVYLKNKQMLYVIISTLLWAALFHTMRLETDEVVEDFDFVLNEKNNQVYEYDYIIDLKQDHIHIDTDDGRCIIIHPDSLQYFIEMDNL